MTGGMLLGMMLWQQTIQGMMRKMFLYEMFAAMIDGMLFCTTVIRRMTEGTLFEA